MGNLLYITYGTIERDTKSHIAKEEVLSVNSVQIDEASRVGHS